MPNVPSDPIDLSSKRKAEHVDRMLDEAIAESFPNSDPVALAMPHDRAESGISRKLQLPTGMRDAWPLLVIGGVIVALLLARRD